MYFPVKIDTSTLLLTDKVCRPFERKLMTHEEILKEQQRLKVLFSAWMTEKMKHEVLTFGKPDGRIVKHYPDGKEEIIGYAK